MHYVIIFERGITAATIRDTLVELFDFDSDHTFAGTTDELERSLQAGASFPLVTILQEHESASQFNCELESGDELARATGELDNLTLATVLCKTLKIRALIDDGGLVDTCYMMVTPDGWHGRILLENDPLDEGVMILGYALQPIPSDPTIRVVDEPYQSGWYPDNQVPTSGYVFPEDRPETPPEGDARQ